MDVTSALYPPPETAVVMMTSKYWPCAAACVTGLAIALAADALVNSKPSDPPAPVAAMLPDHTTDHTTDRTRAARLAPNVQGGPPAVPALYFVPPSKPTPTPRSEKDEAIHQLSLLGLEPTGASLAKALRAGTLFSVDLFLKAGVSAEARDTEGRPMLVVACDAERVQAVERLLAAGASPNLVGPDGRTPLMTAAARGNIGLMQTLLQRGASLAQIDAEGYDALAHAVMAGDPQSVKWLIGQINAATEPAPAPILASAQPVQPAESSQPMAAAVSETEPAEQPTEAAENSAPPPVAERKALVPLALATGKFAIIEPILQFEKPREWCEAARKTFEAALKQQDKPLLRALLTNHAEPPTPEGARQPLLGYVIAWGDPATLRLLLECGADPNTPLASPVEPAFSQLIPQKFVRHYLDTEAGVTPLMIAAGMGRLDLVEVLLEHGAKRNAYTKKWKMAPLSFAARSDSVGVMQQLLGKSPRPEDQHTRIEISLSSQTARLYKNDQVVFTTRVSTGRPGFRTPSGQFVITDKARSRFSSIYHVEMPYFMRLSCSAVGMHAGVVPGHPASHGCIRLPYGAAVRLFRETEVGTLVTIR